MSPELPSEPGDKQELKPAPLSWKLTASQLAYISSVAQGDEKSATGQAVQEAMSWVAKAETSTPASEVCSVANPPNK
jgi:hypothetical protein